MFTLSTTDRYHLYIVATDMRKSFDGLSGLVSNKLESDPCNGDVFIFINKNRDKIKLLRWEGSGYTLYYKRLEQGTFELPAYDIAAGSLSLDYAQLVMLIDGVSIRNVSRRQRYLST